MSGVKHETQCRRVRVQIADRYDVVTTILILAEFLIRQVTLVTVGKSEMHALVRCMVQLICRKVVAEHVPTVVRKPELSIVGVKRQVRH